MVTMPFCQKKSKWENGVFFAGEKRHDVVSLFMTLPVLLLATRNRHKTGELSAMLEGRFRVSDLSQWPDLPEVEETGVTFEENARLKAATISQAIGDDSLWVMADDSGLEVDALEGAPGVRSARYAGERAGDAENLALLLERLAGVEERTARFRCVIALARGGEVAATFDGRCEGSLLDESRGAGGFGYDPIFVPQGESESFAQLPATFKNQVSHRAQALAGALAWLEALPNS